jgi:hypothetical protein
VARNAPTVVVVQRKRSKLFHISVIHTETERVEHGSWFRGKLYPLRCDVSFDGQYMVYLALGSTASTWNGICKLPWLTTVTEAENMGTWFGGGYFASPNVLRTNGWGGTELLPPSAHRSPFKLEPYRSAHGGEDLGVLFERLRRDGFRRFEDETWSRQPTARHPELRVRYAGYLQHGYTFAFWIDANPDLLAEASWANWDASGALWVARPGRVERFSLDDLERAAPSWSIDVDAFEPPPPPDRSPRQC